MLSTKVDIFVSKEIGKAKHNIKVTLSLIYGSRKFKTDKDVVETKITNTVNLLRPNLL